MEVHAHAHTPRKKWTHYFWEFLMLFLAVFCGFLAENQREHYVEAQRAKEYAKSLYNDIKSDTVDIHKGIRHLRFYISAIDSILSVTKSNDGLNIVPGTFYYYSRILSNIYPIDWSSSTLNQLIQSGTLRYFKNKQLVDKINRYFALQSKIDGSSGNDDEQRVVIRNIRNQMLDNTYFSVFVLHVNIDDAVDQKARIPQVDSLMKLMLPLQKGREQYMNEYLNHLSDRSKRLWVHLNKYFPDALITAEEIMRMLKEEYQLK